MKIANSQGITGTTAIIAVFAIFLPWNGVLSRAIYEHGEGISGITASVGDISEIQKDMTKLKIESAVNSALIKELSTRSGINVPAVEKRATDQLQNSTTTTNVSTIIQ